MLEGPEIQGFRVPVIGSDGTIYVGTRRGLNALRPDGSIKWVAEESTQFSDPSIAPNGDVVVGGVGDGKMKLYSISLNGVKNWDYVWGASR